MKQLCKRFVLRSFTLVELLVVISIIGILIGVLIPSVNLAIKKANKVACGANLSGVGKALYMYATDHNFRYPETFKAMGGQYLQDTKVLICKSDDVRSNATDIASLQEKNCSYNLFTKTESGKRLRSDSGSQTVLACDKDGDVTKVTATAFGGNHGAEGGNLLYTDAHVLWINKEDWESGGTNITGGASMKSQDIAEY